MRWTLHDTLCRSVATKHNLVCI